MNVYRKNTIRWTLNGKRVSPNTPGSGEKGNDTLQTLLWHVAGRGRKRKQIPLSEDKNASKALLRMHKRNRIIGGRWAWIATPASVGDR